MGHFKFLGEWLTRTYVPLCNKAIIRAFGSTEEE